MTKAMNKRNTKPSAPNREEKSESLIEIGQSIHLRRSEERQSGNMPCAVGRADCTLHSTLNGTEEHSEFWILNNETYRKPVTCSKGTAVYKNTKMGDILTKYHQGTYSYSLRTNLKRVNEVTVEIHNKATYTPTSKGVNELTIFCGQDTYKFQTLADLLEQQSKHEEELKRKREEERKRKEEIKRLREIEQRLAQEKAAEKKRKAAEEARRKAEEELKRNKEEADRLEEKVRQDNERIRTARSFIRHNVTLRNQHLLDEFQETAKRSHLFDGIPLVIDGGPGTGKTTTMIQRLRFLISETALTDYADECGLTSEQIKRLTDPVHVDNHWIFFSPTGLLLQYLRDNMRDEELNANQGNTFTIGEFRLNMLREYRLWDSDGQGPFKVYKAKRKERSISLIERPAETIHAFEAFCVERVKEALMKAAQQNTSSFSWHKQVLGIKSYCKRAESVIRMEDLMQLFFLLQENEIRQVHAIKAPLDEQIKLAVAGLKRSIDANDNCNKELQQLIAKWSKDQETKEEEETDINSMEEPDESEELSNYADYESKLFTALKPLLRTLSLQQIDTKLKLTKRQQELKAVLDTHQMLASISLKGIGELCWFMKNYAFLCQGISPNLFNQIPRLYKAFRKQQMEHETNIYKQTMLTELVMTGNNKRLHPDEINLLLGYINHLLRLVYKKSPGRFAELNHPFALAFRQWVRHVMGIDEATDYSLLDYYMMYSFRHYEFASVTLCGDIMQGLTPNGIRQWSDLKQFIMPELEIVNLNISYRQLPTLLRMARELYKDEQQEYPQYTSHNQPSPNEPAPIFFISDDEEEKIQWMARRIVEVYKAYDYKMPSVAIFVGEQENIENFIESINDCDLLDGINVADSSGGKDIGRKDSVRVFRLSEVKGMEFEVVFFYDLDRAMQSNESHLIKRYLYVGISRATSHLAATFCRREGNENVLKYFNQTAQNWQL